MTSADIFSSLHTLLDDFTFLLNKHFAFFFFCPAVNIDSPNGRRTVSLMEMLFDSF